MSKIKFWTPTLLVFLLVISEALMYNLNFLKYSDELITVFFVCCILYKLLTKKVVFEKFDFNVLICLFLILLLGLVSNLISGVQKSKTAILIDILANAKTFIAFIGIRVIATPDSSKKALNALVLPAKLLLITGTVFSLLNFVVDLGMSGEHRFGINAFHFIYRYEHLYVITILISLIVLAVDGAYKKDFKIYLVLAVSQMILTTKGPSLIWVPMVFLLFWRYKKKGKIDFATIIVVAAFGILFGIYQIRTYILNSDSPRMLLIKYGIVTANDFFPFGSGFASYGSDASGTYYSSLYYLYGFDAIRGLMPSDTQFLNDNYWPKIIGQFGYLGLIITLYVFYGFFKYFNNSKISWKVNAIIMSAFLYMCIHSLGSSSMCTSASVTLFMVIALAYKCAPQKSVCLPQTVAKKVNVLNKAN